MGRLGGWLVGWCWAGKKGAAAERAMCLTRQPGARPTAIIFAAHSLWQATSMVVIEWIVKDCFASKGKAGAQAMFVLDIFLRQGAYSCAGMLLQPRLHKNWMHFMLDHRVQLQRDKQYLRWIFFLSDGNNPYKGVRAVLMDYPEKWFTMVGCGERRESLELE